MITTNKVPQYIIEMIDKRNKLIKEINSIVKSSLKIHSIIKTIDENTKILNHDIENISKSYLLRSKIDAEMWRNLLVDLNIYSEFDYGNVKNINSWLYNGVTPLFTRENVEYLYMIASKFPKTILIMNQTTTLFKEIKLRKEIKLAKNTEDFLLQINILDKIIRHINNDLYEENYLLRKIQNETYYENKYLTIKNERNYVTINFKNDLDFQRIKKITNNRKNILFNKAIKNIINDFIKKIPPSFDYGHAK